ncbi:MAG: hypothetical protein IJ055_02100 [Oscillospiraceae bacterium]|nr:hypothetical protein [Oscillospiraceae bacterium]
MVRRLLPALMLLYDTGDEVVKGCGGYMPGDEQFREMYHAVQDDLPQTQLGAIREGLDREAEKPLTKTAARFSALLLFSSHFSVPSMV